MTTRVLITGAGGFIGSHLTEELVKTGYSVRAMVHYNAQNNWGWLEKIPQKVLDSVEVFPADIRDPFVVRKSVSGCDIVYHLAALIPIPYSYLAPASNVETNTMGTLNVLQACLEEGTDRIVHTSTSEAYGTAQYVPIDEKHPMVGQSPYSASKIAADKLTESYYNSFGLPVSTIRPFNTFGPRQSARAIIPTIITQALSGAKLISLGSLNPVRDFTYIDDMVRGFMAIANSNDSVGEVTNVGRGEGISVGDLAKLILDLCNSSADIVFDVRRERPEKSEVLQLVCDNTRAREVLGWQPKYSLRAGLERTIDWIGSNLEYYKWEIYNL
jgi:NAD dependent epimerase/dehydratase